VCLKSPLKEGDLIAISVNYEYPSLSWVQYGIFMSEDLKQALERLHHCQATFLENVVVVEKFGEKTVWSGVVSVFGINGHLQATKCYAWSPPIEESTERRYFAVLHVPQIDSPEKAVRAAIVHDHKKK
jgi:hypothetical protein